MRYWGATEVRECSESRHTSFKPAFGELEVVAEDNEAKTRNQRGVYAQLRYRLPNFHMSSAFGDDWFGLKAESFARFFGTPKFLVGQTAIVAIWIVVNITGLTQFDVYPFILLNLMFSLQAAYAAPLILLAQTRQADRDKQLAQADAMHREEISRANEERQKAAQLQTEQILILIKQNTHLTELTKDLSERIESLTREIHTKTVGD